MFETNYKNNCVSTRISHKLVSKEAERIFYAVLEPVTSRYGEVKSVHLGVSRALREAQKGQIVRPMTEDFTDKYIEL
jgi:hypothetical protein